MLANLLLESICGEAKVQLSLVVMGDCRKSLSLKELLFIMVMWSLNLEQTGETVHLSV